MKTRIVSISLCVLLLCSSFALGGQNQCPEPPLAIPRGLYISANLGPAFWLGDVGKYSKPGLGFSFSLAYEWFSFLATEVTYNVGMNETDQRSPPAPGSFTTHGFYAGLRLNLPVQRFDLFARGGIGTQWSTPDILVRLDGFDKDAHLAWLGGLGFVWHTPRRHFWLGLESRAMGAVDFPGVMLEALLMVGCNL